MKQSYTKFKCGKCATEWQMSFPLPMKMETFAALIRGVWCPECGCKKVLMSQATEVPTTKVEVRSIVCIHCGESLVVSPDGATYEEISTIMNAHDAICEQHPLMARIRELEEQLKAT